MPATQVMFQYVRTLYWMPGGILYGGRYNYLYLRQQNVRYTNQEQSYKCVNWYSYQWEL